MLEKEYGYYENHREELIKKYCGKFIVITGETVAGAYDTQVNAYNEAVQKYGLGNFLIQYIDKDDSNIIQRFTSRVFVHV